MTRQIPLRNRKREILAYALVDDDDYERVAAAGSWHRAEYPGVLPKRYRAQHSEWNPDGKVSHVLMHRFVLGLSPNDPWVDHRDGDGLNNQRSNLRFATAAQNAQNRGLHSNNTSGHRGVTWHKRLQKWQVRCGTNGTRVHLGYYDDLEEAAEVARSWRAKNMTFLERESAA